MPRGTSVTTGRLWRFFVCSNELPQKGLGPFPFRQSSNNSLTDHAAKPPSQPAPDPAQATPADAALNQQPGQPEAPISLNDFIKSSGLVGTGGQAKLLIQAGEVSVNGEVETRRRRKLHAGDRVELLGQTSVVPPTSDRS